MTSTITARLLFDLHRRKLALKWVSGRAGEERGIPQGKHRQSEPADGGASLIGHLNFIHRHFIQVIGTQELRYLAEMAPDQLAETLDDLAEGAPLCIIVAGGHPSPHELVEFADSKSIPLFESALGSQVLVNYLQHFMSQTLAERQTVHGVFMEVMGIGVLLTGKSGVGKSELALELISRGHRLIADDAPEFFRAEPDVLSGRCPPPLGDFLEVRGLGVLNVRTMFGASAIKASKYLRLIIHLQQMTAEELSRIDRLQGSITYRRILDVEVPQITVPVAPGRNLAVIVEGAVRNHILSMKGYNASEDFVRRQKAALEAKQ